MTAISFLDTDIQDSLAENGISHVPLLDAHEVSSLLDIYALYPLVSPGTGFHSTMYASSAEYRKKISEHISAIISPKIDRLMSGYRILFSNFIVKESGADTRVGVHQDWHFTSPGITSINIWVPLVDIDSATGLFHVLKGSHKVFSNLRYTPYENDRYGALEGLIISQSTAYAPSAGEALVYDGALVHFSDPNLSERRRIAIGAVMIPADAPNLHYHKPDAGMTEVDVFAVDEQFYHHFDFLSAPVGIDKIATITDYKPLPTLEELNRFL